MKKSIIFVLVIFGISIVIFGCAGFVKKADPKLRTFTEIIEIPNQSKNDLYIKANSWFVHTFNSAESVIEFQDKEAGKVMGNYTFNLSTGLNSYTIRQTISLDIKDNKVRIIISNPLLRTASGYVTLESETGISMCYSEWNKLVNSLEASLKKDTSW